jgi:hypothetical protein
MNEQEARERCAQLAAEHPDRATNNWVPVQQKDGTWAVAHIPLPPPIDAEGSATAEKARPPADTPTDQLLGGNLPPSAFGT